MFNVLAQQAGRRSRWALAAAAAGAVASVWAAAPRTASAQLSIYADPDGNGTISEYRHDNTDRTFTDAEANAVSLGGHLASIANDFENRVADALTGNDVWIGFTDDAAFGGSEFGDTSPFPYPAAGMTPAQEAGVQRGEGYVWTDGSPVLYQNWGGGEPNNVGGENYAHIRGDGMWNDLPNVGRQSVIERPAGTTTANAPMWRVSKHDKLTAGGGTVTPPNSFGPGGSAATVVAGDTNPDVTFADVINYTDLGDQGNFTADGRVTGQQDQYILVGTGFIEVGAGEGGTYTFGLNTDDAAQLEVDVNQDGDFDDAGELVIRDDALQGPTNSAFQAVTFAEGFYPVRYTGGEEGGGADFEVFYALGDFTGPKGTALFAGATLLGNGALDVVQAVPEPGALSALALGGLVLLARRRRRA